VLAHCRSLLTAYKLPARVEFRHELPKTAIGKILRRELRPVAAPGPATASSAPTSPQSGS